METIELSELSYSKFATSVADLRGIHRINSVDDDSFVVSFVFDVLLEFVEAPITYPIIHFSASIFLSDSTQVFHYNFISFTESIDYLFADVVVYPIHVTVFSSTNFFEEFLAGTSAFLLKFGTQVSELSFDLFDLIAVEEYVFACDCEVVYSHIYADGFSCMFECDIFVEAEYEVASSFLVDFQEAFRNIPSGEIFFVAGRNVEWNLDPPFDCADAQNIVFESKRTSEIISNRTIFNDGFAFCFLDKSTSLFYTGDAELCLESELFQSLVNNRLEFSGITDSFSPCYIDAGLESFSINFYSPNYLRSRGDFDFSTNNTFHNYEMVVNIYKSIENEGIYLNEK